MFFTLQKKHVILGTLHWKNPKWFLYGIATIEQEKNFFIFMSVVLKSRQDWIWTQESRLSAKAPENMNLSPATLHFIVTKPPRLVKQMMLRSQKCKRIVLNTRLCRSTSLSIIHLTQGQTHNMLPSNRKPQMSFSWRITSFQAKMWPCSHSYLL